MARAGTVERGWARDAHKVVEVLEAMGYDADLREEGEGYLIVAQVGEGPVVLKFFDCEAKFKCDTMSLNKWYERNDHFHNFERVNE